MSAAAAAAAASATTPTAVPTAPPDSETVQTYSAQLFADEFRHTQRLKSIDALIAAHESFPAQQWHLRAGKRKYVRDMEHRDGVNKEVVKRYVTQLKEAEAEAAGDIKQAFEKRRRFGEDVAPLQKYADRFLKELREEHKNKLAYELKDTVPQFITATVSIERAADLDPLGGAIPVALSVPFAKMKDVLIPEYRIYSDSEFDVIASFVKTAVARDKAYRLCGQKPQGSVAEVLNAECLVATGLCVKPKEVAAESDSD